jgi:CRP/FNR family transcriptional regulator, cyclic AMP receptor protein
MSFQDIPSKELDAFRDYMRVYRKDAVILRENEIDEDGLFLLRTGKVSVFKKNENVDQFIADILAVNFFGEMAVVNGGPRTATVIASSPTAVVYHFQKPDLQIILSEPTWAMLFVRRLTQNLANINEELLRTRQENEQLSSQYAYINKHTTEIFSLLTEVQRDIAMDVVVTAREWKYLNGLAEVTIDMLKTRLPEVYNNIDYIDDEFWKRLRKEEILPDFLEEFIGQGRQKRREERFK